MEYTSSNLDGVIRMLESLKDHTDGDTPVLIKLENEIMFLNYAMVMGDKENKGIILEIGRKPIKSENISRETH
jgi:hypothetical protein